MSTDAPIPPPFEQLDALAYVEVDRFCDHCSYNLRGQPVRRDPATRLVLTRCPECGTFHPANNAATALNPWAQRIAILLWGGWILFCIALLCFSIGGQFAVMGATLDELGRSNWRFHSYYGNQRGIAPTDLEERWANERRFLRYASGLGSAVIGLVSVGLWTILFPHWRRWGYRATAIIAPGLCVLGVSLLIWFGEMRWVPDDVEVMLLAMFIAHLAGGMIGSVIGRPVMRVVLAVFLPRRQRAAFAYLWMVDGKKPPHAA
jgi:hypothetical protein